MSCVQCCVTVACVAGFGCFLGGSEYQRGHLEGMRGVVGDSYVKNGGAAWMEGRRKPGGCGASNPMSDVLYVQNRPPDAVLCVENDINITALRRSWSSVVPHWMRQRCGCDLLSLKVQAVASEEASCAPLSGCLSSWAHTAKVDAAFEDHWEGRWRAKTGVWQAATVNRGPSCVLGARANGYPRRYAIGEGHDDLIRNSAVWTTTTLVQTRNTRYSPQNPCSTYQQLMRPTLPAHFAASIVDISPNVARHHAV